MKQVFWFAFCLTFMTTAIAQKVPLAQRVEYWQQRLDKEIPGGTQRGNILQWARTSRMKASTIKESGDISIRLETIGPISSPGECMGYVILAMRELDDQNRLNKVSVGAYEERCIF